MAIDRTLAVGLHGMQATRAKSHEYFDEAADNLTGVLCALDAHLVPEGLGA